MHRSIQSIVIICIAFTCSSLLYILFSSLKVFPEMTNGMLLSLFLLSSAMMALIHCTHLLPIDNIWIVYLLELMAVYSVLLASSYFLQLFPFSLAYILPTFIIGLLTYVLVVIITFLHETSHAKEINAVIERRNEAISYDK